MSNIPKNVMKMIENLKEIYVNHTEDEIYSVLKDCSMDPNDTAQKLLHQDTFHEVKRKKINREIVEPRRSGPSGRGGRGGRGHHASHYPAQDSGEGRNTSFRRVNGFNHTSYRAGPISSAPVAQDGKRKDKSSPVIDLPNGPTAVPSEGTKHGDTSNALPVSVAKQPEISSRPRSRSGVNKKSNPKFGAKPQYLSAAAPSDVCSSASDPVLDPRSDTRAPAAGAIKREVGIHRSPVEQTSTISTEHKSNAAGKMGGKSQGAGKNHATEILQSSSLTHGSSSSSRPSSNYGNRSQQGMGSQKGPIKEWKPKPANTNIVQGPKVPVASEDSNTLPETLTHSQAVESKIDSEEATSKLQQELESLHVRDGQHVIIPSHIHVPDAVRTGLSFGSFDAAFVVPSKHSTEPEDEDSKTVSYQGKEDIVEEQASSSQNTMTAAEEVEYADSSAKPGPAEISSSGDVILSSSSGPELNDSKETASAPQNSSVHDSSSYSFDIMPPMVGNQIEQMESPDSETQPRDVSRASGFVVQQPVDPSSFYAPFYRQPSENDGRVSPFANHGVASKYAALSSHTSQSPPEGGNNMVLPAPSPPIATQASGVMPSSLTVAQQTMPIFRHPPGIHMPHYHPNLIPYGHYFSPFYVPPPAMHQFLGNSPFPQQTQPGNLYPPPPPSPAPPASVKFPVSQYKPGNNAGNSTHMGVGGGYGPYGVSPAGFNPGPPAGPGNTTTSEDHAASQFKDNVYFTGQQTEGSSVWFQGPGRDISSLPANAFYNFPPHGQHVTYGPTPAGQGTYPAIFHPSQAVTAANVHPLLQQSQALPGGVDMVGPTGSVYQQPQHAQMNWPHNY